MTCVLAAPSSFAAVSIVPEGYLQNYGLKLIQNPFKRRLTQQEITDLLNRHRPVGLLAGLEPLTSDVLVQAASYLKVISRVGVGLENINMDRAKALGMSVFNTGQEVAPAVAEFTVGLIFSLARHICLQDRANHKKQWEKTMGFLLEGKSIGIIGFGRIGRMVAEKMSAMGMSIYVYDPFVLEASLHDAGAIRLNSINDVFSQCDVVSLHMPATIESVGMINDAVLQHSKPGLLLINTARGELINECDLYDALRKKTIGGAALDVFIEEPYQGPLCEMDNVILTPHAASYARETRDLMELKAAENLVTGLKQAGVLS